MTETMTLITKHIVNTPSEIIHFPVGVPNDYRKELIEESYRLKKEKKEKNHSTFKDVFNEDKDSVVCSSYALWEDSNKFDKLFDVLEKAIIEFSIPIREYNYKILNAWLGIYGKGQNANKHCHVPFYKSFCYYISAEEPHTPMVFNEANIEIEAITDRLIIFPSYLNHSVPSSNGGERIMIAGNVGMIWD